MALAEDTSVARFVRFLEPQLSDCLGAAAVEPILARSTSLPLDLIRQLGFELPLAPERAPADLSVRLPPPAALRRLEGFGAADRELAELLRLLTSENQLVAKSANWLEYDIGTDGEDRPSLFARPSNKRSVAPLARALGAAAPAQTSLQRLVDALGPDERVPYVAVMRRRKHELRVLIVSQRGELSPVLEALEECGWAGDSHVVEEVFTRYAPLHRGPPAPPAAEFSVTWALGVGFGSDGGFLERTGIELRLGSAAQAEQMLTRLEGDDLAAAGTWSRLMAWPGHRIDPTAESAPEAFRAVSALTDGRAVTAVVRRIHHVKVAIDPGAALTVKAYLSAGHVLAAPS